MVNKMKRITHKPTLRVLGTSVTLLEILRQQAETDLGFQIEYIVKDVAEAQRIAIMHPESFDLYDQWFHNLDIVWPTRSLQPIDINRIRYWNEINSLPKTGYLFPGAKKGDGSVPFKRLFVQDNRHLSDVETERISMLPLTHNVDSFAYYIDNLPVDLSGKEESWAWLLHPAYAGKTAIQDDAAMGVIDAVLAVQSAGLGKFDNIGNLSLEEIDHLAKVLRKLRKKGQFVSFWSTQDQAAELVRAHQVEIQSLWAPTYFGNKLGNIGYKLATPKEGYRAWYGGMSLSGRIIEPVIDMAYEYLNWWLSGWPGAIMARQGYYISNPERSSQYLSSVEWDYWYAGLPASEPLNNAFGEQIISKNDIRDGGSYEQRMSHIAVWNSVMDEHNYLVRRWKDLLS